MSAKPLVVEELNQLSLSGERPVVLTIGTFDGVHMAHQDLLREAVSRAGEMDGIAAVLTFRNHPRAVVSPEHCPPLIMDWPTKREQLLALGIDVLVGLLFSPELAAITADEFIRQVIAGRFKAKLLLSGPSFHFGAGGEGNVELLAQRQRDFGYTFHRRDPVIHAGEKVSSTRIRSALTRGDVALARALLTRPHRNEGVVIEGDRLGRTIGFPTANLDIEPSVIVPADGVYAVRAMLSGGETWPGMMNIGFRPTVGGLDHRKEVHLVGFEGSLVGSRLRIEYVERLRNEIRFGGIEELKSQLHRDRSHALMALEGQV